MIKEALWDGMDGWSKSTFNANNWEGKGGNVLQTENAEKKTEKKDEEKEKSSVPWVRQLFHLNALSSFGVRRNISHNLRPTMCDHNCVESK